MRQRVPWGGVFPAVTTQLREDLSADMEATARVIENLIRDGVSGLIVCGTVGENCSLTKSEKIAVMETGRQSRADAFRSSAASPNSRPRSRSTWPRKQRG